MTVEHDYRESAAFRASRAKTVRKRYWRDPERARQRLREQYWRDPEGARQKKRERDYRKRKARERERRDDEHARKPEVSHYG
jgi:hypothetical protein